MAILKAHNSFLKANGKVLVKQEGGGSSSIIIGGREYQFVQIGNQLWITENLDWKYDGLSINPSGHPITPAAWYYDRNEAIWGVNGRKCGLLYNQYAVFNINNNLLPSGWRVPSRTDYQNLMNFVGPGGDAVKRALGGKADWALGWNTYMYSGDPYGFNLIPTGSYYNGGFGYGAQEAPLWTSESGWRFITGSGTATEINSRGSERGQAIRLVKDV